MVNASKVLKRRTSKRQTLHDKHKIEKKVREHQRKLRKDMRKNPNKHKKKDPGIPNSWPFKAQLLKQQEEMKEAARLAMIEAREAKLRERERQRQADKAIQAAARMTAQQRRELKRRQAAFAPLHDVLADADVVLIVLDARDPNACRSTALEQALLDCGKLPILLLNKSDLVPQASLDAWIKHLGAQLPTLPFTTCSPEESAASSSAATKGGKAASAAAPKGKAAAKKAAAAAAKKAGGKDGGFDVSAAPAAVMSALRALLASRREALGGADADLSVGVIGFERVGKRAVVRALNKASEEAAAEAGKEGGGGGGLGEGIGLLKQPSLLTPVLTGSVSLNDVLLRKGIAEHVPQPEAVIESFLERCERRSLLKSFGVADYAEPYEFLESFAEKHSLPMPRRLPNGAVDARAAAQGLLRHLSAGKALFFAKVAEGDAAEEGGAADLLPITPLSSEMLSAKWRKASGKLLEAAAKAACAKASKVGGGGGGATTFVELTSGVADEIDLADPEEEMAEAFDGEESDEDMESGEEEDDEGEEEDDDDEEDDEDE